MLIVGKYNAMIILLKYRIGAVCTCTYSNIQSILLIGRKSRKLLTNMNKNIAWRPAIIIK